MTYEQQFLDALKSIFIGAKVEGDSGYINLMKIKANYFEKGVFPVLMKDIDSVCKPFEKGFREELFDKLYDFFQHYFSESGSIYFRNTAQHHNIYEKVYTDDRDVMLFWKTHMLYYVKTDRLFNSMEIEVDGEKFFFDVSGMELKRSNEKRELTYAFKSVKGGVISLTVGYSERGRKTKIDEIVKAAKDKGLTLDEGTLEKAFAVFQKQSEVDYFINKNAKAFLQEQFDLWMYQYIFKGESDFDETRLKQLQAIKGIAYKIIDFIAQFEDELVKIWNKPKFVLNSHYIITLDKLINPLSPPTPLPLRAHVPQGERERAAESPSPLKGEGRGEGQGKDKADAALTPNPSPTGRGESLLKKIFKHKGMKDQIAEWIEFGMISEDLSGFKNPTGLLSLILEKDVVGEPRYPQYQFLPLDTKYFKDLELDILALFDDLDAALDGWLIHSENYQALNTLLPKFRERVKAIYIDPPYNTNASEIIYANKYKHSSWLTLLNDRVDLAKQIQSPSGIICVTIDDMEAPRLWVLLGQIFDFDNHLGTAAIRINPGGRKSKRKIAAQHEYAIFFSKDGKTEVSKLPVAIADKTHSYKQDTDGSWYEDRNLRKEGQDSLAKDDSARYYSIYLDPKTGQVSTKKKLPIEILPIDTSGQKRIWRRDKDDIDDLYSEGEIFSRKSKSGYQLYFKFKGGLEGETPKSFWEDVKFSASEHGTQIVDNLMGYLEAFSFPKSPFAVEECIKVMSADESTLILDYFGGSGTTAHAVMNLNRADGGKRKYILVEMGEHFNTVILPRVKKVAFSSKWKDGKAVLPSPQPSPSKGEGATGGGQGISHFVKYFELEQYEDALKKAHYEDAPLFQGTQDAYASYAFLRDLKMLEAVKVNKKQNQVEVSLSRLYEGIDLAETLSCLTGKWIKRITKDRVEFQDGTTASLSAPDWDDVKPLIWW